MTKVNIISGFLGAGKTTLIKKLISEVYKGEKIALIENEFGEIGIDGGFLKDAGIEIKEMNSGCICCSLVGDFGTALTELAKTYSPERIIIEPTGVGKLSDVVGAIKSINDCDLELDASVTVVDGTKCKMYIKNFGEFYNNQIENASCILMTRMDKITPEKLQESLELLKELNHKASVITTPLSDLTAENILSALKGAKGMAEELLASHEHHHGHGEDCDCGCHEHEHHEHHHEHRHEHGEECSCGCHDHHHHHADEAFTSWGAETVNIFTKAQLTSILESFDNGEYGTVLRAKGIVKGEDGWLHFDYVPAEAEIRTGAPDYTGRICVIGADLDEGSIAKAFGI